SAAQNERCGHLPISDDLAEPCVLLRAGWRIDHLDNLIGTTRPPSREPGARFTHFSFAAQIIEPHDDLCVFSSGFLWHFHSPHDGHGGRASSPVRNQASAVTASAFSFGLS